MSIIGHNKIIDYLDRSIARDKISHAYIFSGPKHLGKFTVALDFAKKIVGNSEQKINPDIIIISPETGEKNIKIDKIRELERELSFNPYFGKWKVVIIDDADKLNISAQNALLKTLEEPFQKTSIILIVKNTDKIISTVKSRCVIKKFNLIKESEIVPLILKKENKKEIKFWALNRPGLAIDLQNEEELEKRKKAQNNLEKIINANLSEKFSFFENLSKDMPRAIEELGFWMVLLRKNILDSCNFFYLDKKKSFNLLLNIEKSLKIISQTNSNPKLVLENLAVEMQ